MSENENLSCAQPHHFDNWQTIPWGKVIFQVSGLQNRIVKAVISKQITAGFPFARRALKVLERYAGKLARTVHRGHKLPGPLSKKTTMAI